MFPYLWKPPFCICVEWSQRDHHFPHSKCHCCISCEKGEKPEKPQQFHKTLFYMVESQGGGRNRLFWSLFLDSDRGTLLRTQSQQCLAWVLGAFPPRSQWYLSRVKPLTWLRNFDEFGSTHGLFVIVDTIYYLVYSRNLGEHHQNSWWMGVSSPQNML